MTRTVNIFARAFTGIKEMGKRAIFFVLLLPILFVALGGLSQKEKWQIKNIDVAGDAVIPQEEIVQHIKEYLNGNYFFVYSRKNSFLFPRKEIENFLLYEYPELEAVVVKKNDLNTLSVEMRERKPYALWCGEIYSEEISKVDNSSICYFFDTTGYLFALAPVFSKGVYLETYAQLEFLNGSEPLRAHIKKSEFDAVYKIFETFKKDIGKLSVVVIKPEGEIEIKINQSTNYPVLNGVEIRMNIEDDATLSVVNLLKALPVQFPNNTIGDKKLYYINVRFGNKIFFGFEK